MAQVREDAALVIECAQRCRMARWWMRKRRAERIAEEEEATTLSKGYNRSIVATGKKMVA